MPLTRSLAVASVAIAAVVLALAAGIAPAVDYVDPEPDRGAHATPTGIERYEAARKRGAPVAVLDRAVALRAAPRADSRRLARVKLRTEWKSPAVLAVTGRRGRWLRVIAAELPNGRRGWMPVGAARYVANPWRIRADLSSRQVTVLRRGRVVRRFSVAVGAITAPTPTGSFAVTDKIHMRRGSPYGCCALAITGHQPQIPQGWTGGDRLAIHGTLFRGTIGSAASNGCLRARDGDARFLIERVALGTIVRIRA